MNYRYRTLKLHEELNIKSKSEQINYLLELVFISWWWVVLG